MDGLLAGILIGGVVMYWLDRRHARQLVEETLNEIRRQGIII